MSGGWMAVRAIACLLSGSKGSLDDWSTRNSSACGGVDSSSARIFRRTPPCQVPGRRAAHRARVDASAGPGAHVGFGPDHASGSVKCPGRVAESASPGKAGMASMNAPYERQRLEDIGYMTSMTLTLLGNYAQTGHFGGPLAYTPFNVA